MRPSPTPSFLQVTEEGAGRISVRFPAGTTLTGANAGELGRELAALLDGRDRPHLAVDLGGIDVLTSLALAEFVTLNARVRESGGRLTLSNLRPIVRQVFTITKLDTVLEVHPAA